MNKASLMRADEGAALLEFACVLPVFLLLLVGVVDYSLFIQQRMHITEAAAMGVAYGSVSGNEQDVAGMRKAALAEMPGASVTATAFWTCSVGGTHTGRSSTCADGTLPMQWVQVEAVANVFPLLVFPGIANQQELHGVAVRRVARHL